MEMTGSERWLMARAAAAGLAYVAVVFAAGFALGTLRFLVLVPTLGESIAVLLELPLMLVISWAACRWLISYFSVSPRMAARVVMGGSAFTVLMIAELGVSTFVFGRTPFDHLRHYAQLSALLGLAGQLAFAAFPVVQGIDAKGSNERGTSDGKANVLRNAEQQSRIRADSRPNQRDHGQQPE